MDQLGKAAFLLEVGLQDVANKKSEDEELGPFNLKNTTYPIARAMRKSSSDFLFICFFFGKRLSYRLFSPLWLLISSLENYERPFYDSIYRPKIKSKLLFTSELSRKPTLIHAKSSKKNNCPGEFFYAWREIKTKDFPLYFRSLS